MKIKFHFPVLFFCLFVSKSLSAQIPGIRWQTTVGGNYGDRGVQLLVLPDGDIMWAGNTNSSSSDLGEPIGFTDGLLARYSKNGVRKWVKRYGHPFSFVNIIAFSQTSDGGFVIACASSILKVNASGDVEWENGYLASGYSYVAAFQTADNGYMVCLAGSRIGIIKLSSTGAKIQERYYGGTIQYTYDNPVGMLRTMDGGFAIFGETSSRDGDFADYPSIDGKAFLFKLDSNGVKSWVKCYTDGEYCFYAVKQDSSGNYYCGGVGYFTDDYRGSDAMISKMDVQGSQIWRKTYIGTTHEEVSAINLTKDHGVIFGGLSSSRDGDFSSNVYNGTFWTGKLDQKDGAMAFQLFLGGPTGASEAYDIIQQDDEGLVVLGKTDSLNPYQTTYIGGGSDIWLVKLGAINTIKGTVFLDVNGNGIKDPIEKTFNFGKINISNDRDMNDQALISSVDGNFERNTDTGSYTSAFIFDNPYYTTVNSVKHSVFTNYYNTDSIVFPVTPVPDKTDLQVGLVALTPARTGAMLQYKLIYKNRGTQPVNTVNVKFMADSRLTWVGATPAPSTSGNNTYSWNIPALNPLDTGSITLLLRAAVPPLLNLRDTLQAAAFITPINNDLTPFDDTAYCKQLVTGSYDPNDKTESNAGLITAAQVNNGDYLHYLIRFQNTGTDTAFNIYIRDTLDSRLDWSSFLMVSASHNYELQIIGGNKINWSFNNIKLPDSTVDQQASHGYIFYRIKPKPVVAMGDTIHNQASIYFDFNLPVATGDARTIVVNKVVLPVTLSAFTAALKQTAVELSWKTASEANTQQFDVQRSADGVNYNTIGQVKAAKLAYGNSYLFRDEKPAAGYNYYRLKINDRDGTYAFSGTELVNNGKEAGAISILYPNPVTGQVTIQLSKAPLGLVQVQVFNQAGAEMFSKKIYHENSGDFKANLDLQKLPNGSYILRVVLHGNVYVHKLLLQ